MALAAGGIGAGVRGLCRAVVCVVELGRCRVSINDEAYRDIQNAVQKMAVMLVRFDPELLDLFIERARTAQDLGPVLHPSEWMAGTEKLAEVVRHAEAIRTARYAIIEATLQGAQ
jgi:hypothetical protein